MPFDIPLLRGEYDQAASGALLLFTIVASLILGGIGAAVGAKNGRAVAGFVLGFLFGPLGFLILMFLGPAEGERQIGGRRGVSARRRRSSRVSRARPDESANDDGFELVEVVSRVGAPRETRTARGSARVRGRSSGRTSRTSRRR